MTPPLKVQSYRDTIQSLEDVQQFLGSRGHMQKALCIGSTIDSLTSLQLASTKQNVLNDFLELQQ